MTFDQYWLRLGRHDYDSADYRLAREAWQASDRSAREACAELCRLIATETAHALQAGVTADRWQAEHRAVGRPP